MVELCRRFVAAVNATLRILFAIALLAFLVWGFFITDQVECWLKGAEYMEARGGVCD
jgi:hypothetical protein